MLGPTFSIVADESLNARIVEALRESSISVFYINEGYKGIPDQDVVGFASRGKDLVLTEDKDFGEMFIRGEILGIDVILLRYSPGEEDTMLAQLLTALHDYLLSDRQQLTVVTPAKVRQRFI